LAFKNILIFILVFSLFSCARTELTKIDIALGTVCSVTLFEHGHESVFSDIFNRIHEIENLMSVNIPASDISRINAASGIEPVQVHEDTFKVIQRAVFFAQLSDGAFDPTIGSVVSLWGINGSNPRVPSAEETEKSLSLVNWRNIELNAESCSVFLTQRGMALDLGAIAKGYAADEAAQIIKRAGIKRALIDLGGNIIYVGKRKDAVPGSRSEYWRVGIQTPGGNRGAIFGILHIANQTVVTSGVYERFFTENGTRYHHLFSPTTGYPVQNGLISVTVVTDVSMDADALSTAAFVLGYEKAIVLLESLGVEAVFVFEDKSIRTTKGANFTLTDRTFQMEARK